MWTFRPESRQCNTREHDASQACDTDPFKFGFQDSPPGPSGKEDSNNEGSIFLSPITDLRLRQTKGGGQAYWPEESGNIGPYVGRKAPPEHIGSMLHEVC